MKIEKIKPIPQYILKAIQKRDKKACPNPESRSRFYSYFTKNDGELSRSPLPSELGIRIGTISR